MKRPKLCRVAKEIFEMKLVCIGCVLIINLIDALSAAVRAYFLKFPIRISN